MNLSFYLSLISLFLSLSISLFLLLALHRHDLAIKLARANDSEILLKNEKETNFGLSDQSWATPQCDQMARLFFNSWPYF